MIKFTIVRHVTVKEIYEVVAATPMDAIAKAEAGEGLNETIKVGVGSFGIADAANICAVKKV